jgi:hypothetical protein
VQLKVRGADEDDEEYHRFCSGSYLYLHRVTFGAIVRYTTAIIQFSLSKYH